METFYDNENGYLRWVNANSAGYVLNCYKATSKSGGPWMLHRADCSTIRNNENFTTGQYYKACSGNKEELIQWADKERTEKGYDTEVERCTKCNP